MDSIILIIYAAYLILCSIITFIAYGADKRKAQKGKWRTKEKTLLGLSFFGGAYGGFLGMKVFHHKTTMEHWYFTVVNILGIVLHTVALGVIVYFTFIA